MLISNPKTKINYKVGQTYHILVGFDIPYKIHIVAVVEKNMIVYRWYARHNQCWNYELENKNILDIKIARAEREMNS